MSFVVISSMHCQDLGRFTHVTLCSEVSTLKPGSIRTKVALLSVFVRQYTRLPEGTVRLRLQRLLSSRLVRSEGECSHLRNETDAD